MVTAVLTLGIGCLPPSSDFPHKDDVDAGPDLKTATDAEACIAQTDEELCKLLDADCGTVVATDSCGTKRVVDNCGTCATGVCDPRNHCCPPETDEEFCVRYSAGCGELEAVDQCGQLRVVADCGECMDGVMCEGTSCGPCVAEADAEICERLGHQCGQFTAPDRCGSEQPIDCGQCVHGAMCDLPAGPGNARCLCPGGTVEFSCDDGEDNDCDGMTDCEDPDCDGQKCGPGIGDLAPECSNMRCPL